MNIEIKNRFTNKIILCGEYESIKDCLEKNRGTNLEGADLRGTNLEGAYLRGAYLEGAKNITFPILNIQGTQHHLFYMSGKISIGCENHTIDKWIKDYKTIGEEHGYTDEQIKEYFGYIKICKKLAEDNKKEKKDGLLNKKGE